MSTGRVDWPYMCWSKPALEAWCARQWLSAGELYVAMGASPEKLVSEMGKPLPEPPAEQSALNMGGEK